MATIKRRLRTWHLRGRKAACKTYLTEHTKALRLAFCKKYKNLDWARVMFTDEVKIETSKHGMNWVRRPPNSRYEQKYIREVNRSGRCRIMLWGAIANNEMLDLKFLDGNLTKEMYTNEMLDSIVRPYFEQHPNMIYQHDGAGPHRANLAKAFLQDHNIQVLQWPPYSPDLNIIENLWNILKDEVGPLNHIGPNQREELILVITEAWDKIRTERPRLLRKLYTSMKKRVDEVIKQKGGHIGTHLK